MTSGYKPISKIVLAQSILSQSAYKVTHNKLYADEPSDFRKQIKRACRIGEIKNIVDAILPEYEVDNSFSDHSYDRVKSNERDACRRMFKLALSTGRLAMMLARNDVFAEQYKKAVRNEHATSNKEGIS